MIGKFALVFAFASADCVAEATDSRPVVVESGMGLLVVDWSISGARDPAFCQQSDADVINVAVETSGGSFIGEFEQACEVFSTAIELAPNGYFADAVLLDPDGAARTTPVDLGYFEIFGDDELLVPIDFPSDSFY
jgi:hypothetical protein